MSQYTLLVQNWPWLLSTLIILAISVFTSKLRRHRSRYVGLPSPAYSKTWGNLKVLGEAMSTSPPGTYYSAPFTLMAKKYSLKGLFYLDTWPVANVMMFITDPDIGTQIQNNTSGYDRSKESVRFFKGLLGKKSLFTTWGKEWQHQRSWFAPAFSLTHLLTLVPGMIEETLVFREKLTKFAQSGEVFRLNDHVSQLTFDVIGRTVIDVRLRTQTQYSPALYHLSRGAAMLAGMGHPLWKRLLTPIAHYWHMYKLNSYLRPLIRRQLATTGGTKSILGLAQKGYTKTRELDGTNTETISNDSEFMQIALDNAKTFFTAGYDTTSSTTSYMFHLLSQRPDYFKTVSDEHDQVFGNTLESTIAALSEKPQLLNQLPVTNAILKETLRLFPIGFTARDGQPGTSVTYNNRTYPTDNCLVVVFNPQMQRNPEFWTHPNDFYPERWLDPEINDKGKENGSWAPFEKGPRNCIGQQLAMVEMKVIAALTLRWFDFEARYPKGAPSLEDWGGVVYQEFSGTAKPVNGLPAVVRMRKH